MFSATRTYHRVCQAMSNAGFVGMRLKAWMYGSGFPKSLNVGKALEAYVAFGSSRPEDMADLADKGLRPVIATKPGIDHKGKVYESPGRARTQSRHDEVKITKPGTDLGRKWDGYGTALKPAWEPIVCARKPE